MLLQALLLKLHNARQEAKGRSKEAQKGGIKKIIDIMSHNKHMTILQQCGCSSLGEIMQNSAPRKQLVLEMKGPETILDAVKALPKDKKIHKEALKALQHIAQIPQYYEIQTMLDEKDIEGTVSAMRCLSNLEELSRNFSVSDTKSSVTDSIKYILSSMKNHSNLSCIQKVACKIFKIVTETSRYLLKQDPVKAIIDEGGIEAILNSKNVCIEGCWVIARLCSGRTLSFVKQKGVLPVMVRSINNFPDECALQKKVCGILNSLLLEPDNLFVVNIIKTEKGINGIISAMKKHHDQHKFLEQACWTLKDLSKYDDESKVAIAEAGGIDVILHCLKDPKKDDGLAIEACYALTYLAQNQKNMCVINKNGGIQAIIKCMIQLHSDIDIQIQVCKFLQDMCMKDDSNNVNIAQAGGIEAVVSCIKKHQYEASVLEEACKILSLLATKDENQCRFLQGECIKSILHIMKQDHTQVQKLACKILKNLSVHNDCKIAIGEESGCIKLIVDTMNKHELQEDACRALIHLCDEEKNKKAIRDEGGIKAIVSVMNKHDVQEKACNALINLCSHEENSTAIREAGGIEAVIKAMNQNLDNDCLQLQAIKILRSVCIYNGEEHRAINLQGGIQAIVCAMNKHVGNSQLQQEACRTLKGMCLHDEKNKTIIFQAEGVKPVVTAMEKHENNTGVQREAFWTLAHLAASIDIANGGGVEAIKLNMDKHPDDQEIQERARGILKKHA